jgi:hypothetical protein
MPLNGQPVAVTQCAIHQVLCHRKPPPLRGLRQLLERVRICACAGAAAVSAIALDYWQVEMHVTQVDDRQQHREGDGST